MSVSYNNIIKLWDAITGGLQKTLVGYSGPVYAVALSLGVSAVAFSLDGKQIASGSYDNTIKLWDATTGGLQQTLVGHSGPDNAVAFSSVVSAIAFSLDGKQIASGSYNNTIKL